MDTAPAPAPAPAPASAADANFFQDDVAPAPAPMAPMALDGEFDAAMPPAPAPAPMGAAEGEGEGAGAGAGLSRWVGDIPAFFARTKFLPEDPWKAVSLALLVFVVLSYLLRINWNSILDKLVSRVSRGFRRAFFPADFAKDEKAKADAKAKADHVQQVASTTFVPVELPSAAASGSETFANEDETKSKSKSKPTPTPEAPVAKPAHVVTPTPPLSHTLGNVVYRRATSTPGLGNQFCLVGTVGEQRGCVLVRSEHECASKQLFATKAECLGHKPAAVAAAAAA